MSKRLVLIFLFVNLSVISFAISPFPMGDPNEIKFSGITDYNQLTIGGGESKNEAISPNLFHTLSIELDFVNSEIERKNGILFYEVSLTPTIMAPSVATAGNILPLPIPTGAYNYKFRNEYIVGYRFFISGLKMPQSLDLSIGPYLKFDWMMEYYPDIDNIGVQTFLFLNLGSSIDLKYTINKFYKVGLNVSAFLIGMDMGRKTYNKILDPSIELSTYSNYMDLDIKAYYIEELSRSEFIKLEIVHTMQSIHGDYYPVISGENRFTISYNRRLFR